MADRGAITQAECREYKAKSLSLRAIAPELLKVVERLVSERVGALKGLFGDIEHGSPYRCDWTLEGPRILGNGVVISPPESTALLDRWIERVYERINDESRKKRKLINAWERGQVLAALQACNETYNRTPNEAEMKELKTELSRKYDLFYQFSRRLLLDSALRVEGMQTAGVARVDKRRNPR